MSTIKNPPEHDDIIVFEDESGTVYCGLVVDIDSEDSEYKIYLLNLAPDVHVMDRFFSVPEGEIMAVMRMPEFTTMTGIGVVEDGEIIQ